MTRYKALAKAYLDQKGVKYSEPKDTLLAVTYKADNMSEITIIIDFQNEGNRAQFVCFSIGNFDKNQFAKGLVACNACNTKYRWVKYYIGDDGRVVVPAGAVVVSGSKPISKGPAAGSGVSLYCPVIVKYRDDKTAGSVQLEEFLR